jgi:fructosamine-3-kinase
VAETEAFESMRDELCRLTGSTLRLAPSMRVHGGCISEAYRWESDKGSVFVKVAPASSLDVFKAEAAGLEELRTAAAVRVPKVLAMGVADSDAFLALEWIEFGTSSAAAQRLLGERLARQHRVTSNVFGWHRPNTIGSTPQINEPSCDWPQFFGDHRLGFQLDLAAQNGYSGALQQEGAKLLERIGSFFEGYRPQPSLLHGDLWGGNWATDIHGEPVLFDPAVYYGDREADLAMTRLFGGFGSGFYAAYEAAWPLAPGAPARVKLYNLYHVLNHLNLFGAGYLPQAESLICGLLRRSAP